MTLHTSISLIGKYSRGLTWICAVQKYMAANKSSRGKSISPLNRDAVLEIESDTPSEECVDDFPDEDTRESGAEVETGAPSADGSSWATQLEGDPEGNQGLEANADQSEEAAIAGTPDWAHDSLQQNVPDRSCTRDRVQISSAWSQSRSDDRGQQATVSDQRQQSALSGQTTQSSRARSKNRRPPAKASSQRQQSRDRNPQAKAWPLRHQLPLLPSPHR